ncbi:MAG TPA: AraC family transcriptional regulator [Terriglobia bacterium]|jgi:transcriptional regulator GlxA family with amidase domain|nr:AraC family transcriptional regulator [Terriglobia bacterium]
MSTSTLDIGKHSAIFPGNSIPARQIDPIVRQAAGFMNRNLHRKLLLDELARETSLSSPYFSHLFKSQAGVSPGRYLKSIRLQRAKNLLEGTTLSVKEVAARVGLDPSGLIRCFKEAYGLTPRRYRLQHRFSGLESGLVSGENSPEATWTQPAGVSTEAPATQN